MYVSVNRLVFLNAPHCIQVKDVPRPHAQPHAIAVQKGVGVGARVDVVAVGLADGTQPGKRQVNGNGKAVTVLYRYCVRTVQYNTGGENTRGIFLFEIQCLDQMCAPQSGVVPNRAWKLGGAS